ncbi:hypothetical protein SAMN06265348_11792 [Pedobacter westerhofensis]|uniref:Uncharacterized protein n=1 Tax=Pedobacter westerhofensis TaxID=425512 RepID=A0A521FR91_9SPHI|nr:hypothetical protein [Pedobacter westerhofensis]SMO98745.1 hypothetical protein SAMN06265348_11792 [Pedobacter westerhofensis]
MKLIEKINRHEVLRRWAVGEVYSEFFNPVYESSRQETLTMLLSGSHYLEKEGIDHVLELKQGLVDSISLYINWYRAILELNKSDLDMVYTLQLPGWRRNTDGSYLISDAARNISQVPHLDSRVTGIYRALKNKEVKLEGITLLAVDKVGPYVAVEGTGRLTSIYMAQQLDHLDIMDNNEVEVTLGLY